MPTNVKITVSNITIKAALFDSDCAKAISERLPIEATPNGWGDEFYFEIPVVKGLDETATRAVKVGDIGYWPPGHALAIFFGPTPLSADAEPVPASEVNVVGKIIGDATILRNAKSSSTIRLEKAL